MTQAEFPTPAQADRKGSALHFHDFGEGRFTKHVGPGSAWADPGPINRGWAAIKRPLRWVDEYGGAVPRFPIWHGLAFGIRRQVWYWHASMPGSVHLYNLLEP